MPDPAASDSTTPTAAVTPGRYAYRVFRLVVTVLIFGFAILGIFSLLPEEEPIQLAKPPPLTAAIYPLQLEKLPAESERHTRLVPAKEWHIALVSGQIAKRPADNGTELDTGDLVIALDLIPFEAQLASANARIADVEASLVQAEAQLARIEKLRAQGDESERALDDARSARDRARAGLADAKAQRTRAQYDLQHARFEAPTAGVVSHLTVEVGQRVAEGQVLGRFSQVNRLLARVLVDWEVRRGVQNGQKATIIDARDRQFEATLVRSARVQSGDTGQFELEFEIQNGTGQLASGEPVRCRFRHGDQTERLRVPRPSLYEEYGAWRALVPGNLADGAWVVRSRPVTLGNINPTEGWVEVYSGLAPGDRLIVPPRGATIRDGLRVVEGPVVDVWLPPYAQSKQQREGSQ